MAITSKLRVECEAVCKAAQAVAGGSLQTKRAQWLQNYSLFRYKWGKKGAA